MNARLIPKTLHHLRYLVNSFSDEDADNLNVWLIQPDVDIQSIEYEKLSSFFMAFEYAETILEDR